MYSLKVLCDSCTRIVGYVEVLDQELYEELEYRLTTAFTYCPRCQDRRLSEIASLMTRMDLVTQEKNDDEIPF